MGHLCRLQGRWQEARKHFSVALQRRPKSPILHYYVGVVSEELGTQEAMKVGALHYDCLLQHLQTYSAWPAIMVYCYGDMMYVAMEI